MVKVKVTYNAKPKRSEVLEVSSFQELVAEIYKTFNIEEGKINFMKPRLKVPPYPRRISKLSKKM
jgi:hypothetical protein